MFDFLMISTRSTKRGVIEIYPKFIIKNSSDLMIRGGDFYAIWLEDRGLWSTDEQDVVRYIDRELDIYAKENSQRFDSNIQVLHMWDNESGMIDSWHKYCQKQMWDNYHMLDGKLVFTNSPTDKKDYSSKRLTYPLEPCETPAYNRLTNVLYAEEERHKFEWAIGAIVTGASKKLQKFMVFYGAAGTGKSTIVNIIDQLFEGYSVAFSAKELGSASSAFAMEQFRANPLVAIDNDAKLSRIDDNTRINKLVSHEVMTVNEKFQKTYTNSFQCFLFLATNEPVKITDAKSGLIRRLIDVVPTGDKIPVKEYNSLVEQVKFELGGIACHCRDVYLADPHRYDDYIPTRMLGATNDFYNFVLDSYPIFKQDDGVSASAAWAMYKTYCEEARVLNPLSSRPFKEELKNYFREFKDRPTLSDGTRPRQYYSGFRFEKFMYDQNQESANSETGPAWLNLAEQPSIFDTVCADCPAQYASSKDTPTRKWDNVVTKLSDLDTSKVHYAKVQEAHIVADFDMVDENGNKSLELNMKEAVKWPPTYAELSKSGAGIHLHYMYTGDVSKLSRVYDDHIEIKVFTGKSSLRRKLTKCNNLSISEISSGLPLKEDSKIVNFESIKNEKGLRTLIKRNLAKEIHPGTKPSVDFIYKILEDAYNDGLNYDVTNMRGSVLAFAAGSTHQADYCIKLVNKMKFKSDEPSEPIANTLEEKPLVFYDVEVFPNLFLVNWKVQGEGKPVARMINPKPKELEELLSFRLVGFNCRRYDNHILYARYIGYDNEQLYKLSQKIISGNSNCFFGEAYNLSYTDVYDFSSKKQSLKKFEIELGIHHQELGLPWDQPVPEELWIKVAEYCDNDVLATEAVFNARKADFTARQILADVAGMTVNDTTNSLTTRIIFGKNKKPQNVFNYRNMGVIPTDEAVCTHTITPDGVFFTNFGDEDYTVFDECGCPIFPGYKYENGKSTYRGEEVGEGGYVYSEPGMYSNIALLDIASMHPSSIVAEKLFGEEYTQRFKDILDARIAIKHKDFDKARKMLNGALAKYLNDENAAADLAQALKIAINSVYGLTAANFENAFRDARNKDNIVAKRGALFMINLKHEVQKRGFTVAHIKTDSIKIPDATPEIIQFVMDYGQQYGYNFEHEATYDRMCLVNDAVYIAKYATVERCVDLYGQDYVLNAKDTVKDCKKHPGEWTATGTQFQVPYVFKKLFSREDIKFEDMCETKSVSTAIYIDRDPEEALRYINNPNMTVDTESDIWLDNKHLLHFVGKVGLFTPVKPGAGGGTLVRKSKAKDGTDKYDAVTGTKGHNWMESEMVRILNKEDYIDRSYYDNLVTEAAESISKHGDFEWFTSDDVLEAAKTA